MRSRSPLLLSITGVVVLLLVAGGAYFGFGLDRGHTSDSDHELSTEALESDVGARPQGIIFNPDSTATPTIITTLPTEPPSTLFANPNQPAFEPETGFAPDAQRILEIAALQLSLEKYRKMKGQYPSSLSELFPEFAPVDENRKPLSAPPTDPETGSPYDYIVDLKAEKYQLTAKLDNGKPYTVAGSSNH